MRSRWRAPPAVVIIGVVLFSVFLQEIIMATTFDGTTEQVRASARRLKNDLSGG